jgi:hypothetical protein
MRFRRLRRVALVAMLPGLLGGCATLSHATHYSADAVRQNIHDDFEGGHYCAGIAHSILSPLTFAAVMIGDPAARTLPEPPRAPDSSGSH